MGRLPLPRLPRRRRSRAAVQGRAAARPLFPGGRGDGSPRCRRTGSSLDGELIIPVGGALSFEALQMRLHPAASRIRKLAAATPAQLMLFDCLALGGDAAARRAAGRAPRRARGLPPAARRDGPAALALHARPRGRAAAWLDRAGGALDGVVAKRRDEPYRPGERAMLKVKQLRTADCVVGGFRYAAKGSEVGSLLLGLYNEAGMLDHVGFTSAIPAAEKAALTRRLEALVEPPGFTGDAPGGPSRWSTERIGRLAAAAARAGRRGPLRPCHRRPLPPRHQIPALAARTRRRRNAGWISSAPRRAGEAGVRSGRLVLMEVRIGCALSLDGTMELAYGAPR